MAIRGPDTPVQIYSTQTPVVRKGPLVHLSFFWLLWLDAHWQALLGWLTGLITLAKVGKYFTKMAISVNRVFERFEEAEQTLHLLATNHLPHLQTEMERMNEGIADLQDKSGRSTETLIEIATILRERE